MLNEDEVNDPSVEDKPTSSNSSKAEEQEEQLDEAAMRAAEIHEVLSGLKEFKDRIIDGKSCAVSITGFFVCTCVYPVCRHL